MKSHLERLAAVALGRILIVVRFQLLDRLLYACHLGRRLRFGGDVRPQERGVLVVHFTAVVGIRLSRELVDSALERTVLLAMAVLEPDLGLVR